LEIWELMLLPVETGIFIEFREISVKKRRC
jgi:hypothetical protein